MTQENPWKKRFERERAARKEAEKLLEIKSSEIYDMNKNLEDLVCERTLKLEKALKDANIAKEVKSNFLANMSHEIRTPMNAILGFLQLLSKDELTKSQRGYLEIINASAETLLSTLNDILDFSKIEKDKVDLELMEVESVVGFKNCMLLYANSAEEKNINFKYNIDENIHYCLYMDMHKLRQIMSNLITNAIKFTDAHKNVEIDIVLKRDMENSQALQFSVKDQGIGIAKENQDKIFDAFLQADNSTNRIYGGTGLGLSISASLIKIMGGELSIESEISKGSIFSFELEFDKCKKKNKYINEHESIDKAIIQDINKELKILIADDYEFNQILITEMLKTFGIKCDICEDGQMAVELALKNSYDVILMDINMPILNGMEAAKILKNTHHLKTPVIALTANAMEGDKEKFLEAGMDDYIAKPVDIDILAKVLGKYIPIDQI